MNKQGKIDRAVNAAADGTGSASGSYGAYCRTRIAAEILLEDEV